MPVASTQSSARKAALKAPSSAGTLAAATRSGLNTSRPKDHQPTGPEAERVFGCFGHGLQQPQADVHRPAPALGWTSVHHASSPPASWKTFRSLRCQSTQAAQLRDSQKRVVAGLRRPQQEWEGICRAAGSQATSSLLAGRSWRSAACPVLPEGQTTHSQRVQAK